MSYHRAKGAAGLGKKRARSPSPPKAASPPSAPARKTKAQARLKPKTRSEVFVPPPYTAKQHDAWVYSINNKAYYEALREEGFSKEASARISNSKEGQKVRGTSTDDAAKAKARQGEKIYRKAKRKAKK